MAAAVDPSPNEKLASSDPALREHDVDMYTPSLRGRTLTAALAFVAGTGFTLFGCVYDWLYASSFSLIDMDTLYSDMTRVLCPHC